METTFTKDELSQLVYNKLLFYLDRTKYKVVPGPVFDHTDEYLVYVGSDLLGVFRVTQRADGTAEYTGNGAGSDDPALTKAWMNLYHKMIIPVIQQHEADLASTRIVQRAAINSTSVIAGSDYDNLPLKELKHKAARFDAMRNGEIDTKAAQVPPVKPELEDTTGWDRTLIEMWNKGHSRDEIAQRVHVSKDRVTNRVTELRNKFGEKIIPYDKDRRKLLIKS